MNEQEFLKQTARIMSDMTPVRANMSIQQTWILISAIQLASRHPGLNRSMKRVLTEIIQEHQKAILALHPEAEELLNMGWNPETDVDENGVRPTLKPVVNSWTIYTDADPKADVPALASLGRPQDWGDPRWMYRVYTLEAQGYRNTVHCWLETHAPVNEYEHLKMFAGLIATTTLPGTPPELSGRDFLAEDDFWDESWGTMPPRHDRDEDEEF
jgi:hypothetical protein